MNSSLHFQFLQREKSLGELWFFAWNEVATKGIHHFKETLSTSGLDEWNKLSETMKYEKTFTIP